MSLWGDAWDAVKDTAGKVWDAVKDTAGKVWDGVKGVWHFFGGLFAVISNFVKNLISHLSLVWEIPLVYLGWMPEKKMKLRVLILSDESGALIARRSLVEAVVEIAQIVFKRELNITIVGAFGPIVWELAEPAPTKVLEPPCSTGLSDVHTQFKFIFTEPGAWYRSRLARSPGGTFFGYGTPVTMFVVRDVQGKAGCAHLAWWENYGYIDPTALPPSPDVVRSRAAEYTTLPHEIGHCCDLLTHRKPKENLMYLSQAERSGTRLTKWQKAIARTSTHVTYI